MPKNRIEGMCACPLRHVGFTHRNGAAGLQPFYGGIGMAGNILSKKGGAIGGGNTCKIVVVLDRNWQTP